MDLFSCLCLLSTKIISTMPGFFFLLLLNIASGDQVLMLACWVGFYFHSNAYVIWKVRGLLSIFFSDKVPAILSISRSFLPVLQLYHLAFVYPVISFPFPLQILSLMLFISLCKCLSENYGNLDLHEILSRTVQFTFMYLPSALWMVGCPRHPAVFIQSKLVHSSCPKKVYEQMNEVTQRAVTQQHGEGLQRVPSVLR